MAISSLSVDLWWAETDIKQYGDTSSAFECERELVKTFPVLYSYYLQNNRKGCHVEGYYMFL